MLLVTVVRRHASTIILQPHGSQAERLCGSGNRIFKLAVARLLRHIDGVFLLSSEEVEAVTAFSPNTQAFLVRNPYDPACLKSTPVEIRDDQYRVLFVGRMVREKGVLELVAAAADSDGRGALSISFVGDGPAVAEAQTLADRLGLSDFVEFCGLADAGALRKAYLSAQVLALPSYSEGFPTVISEAMGFGLPVVCTRIRGAADYLVDGINALFVQPKDVTGLRHALISLRDDPALRRRIGTANLEGVKAFDPSLVANHYKECIERTRDLQVRVGGVKRDECR